MPANPSTSEMGARHVEHAAGVLGAVPSAASGSKWQNPADGRSPHDGPYPIAIEGKSTRGKSLAITLDMIAKLREQSLGENPVLPLRWYGTDDLTEVTEDWAAVPLDFLGEVLASARAWVSLETELGSVSRDDVAALILKTERLGDSLAEAHDELKTAGEVIYAREREVQDLRSVVHGLRAQAAGQFPPVPPEMFRPPWVPWGVIRSFSPQERERRQAESQPGAAGIAAAYAADGTMRTYLVNTIRVERAMSNRPKLFVDEVQVRDADLYGPDGVLQARVCRDDPSIEVG